MKELTEEENLKTEETRELMASLDKTQHELTEYQTNMVSINKYASDLRTYIAVKKIEKGVVVKVSRPVSILYDSLV
jgi:flagellar biosynthesis chaperone FliJ